jgi:hypothetical protein
LLFFLVLAFLADKFGTWFEGAAQEGKPCLSSWHLDAQSDGKVLLQEHQVFIVQSNKTKIESDVHLKLMVSTP